MHIVLVGLNHETAPVEVREQAAFPETTIGAVQKDLKQQPGIHEVTIVSTCNRTEVYTVSVCASAGEAAGRGLLSTATPHLYVYRDQAAVEHLLRVAAGINSAVLGETPILGQVRRAAELARDSEVTGRILSSLFQQAVHAGKRARTETAISHHTVSVAGGAVALAREKLGGLQDRTVLVIGTGAMSAHAAATLRNERLGKLIVASRSAARAAERASAWKSDFTAVEPVLLEAVPEKLYEVDAVIAATTSTEPLLGAEAVSRVTATSQAPLVIVDIAVPRNVDPAVRQLDGVRYFDIDDVAGVVDANMEQRRGEIAPVEQIIAEETESFMAWFHSLWVQPIIVDLRSRAEEIRSDELQRALRRLAGLSPEQREVVDVLTQSIISKLLHQPTIRLKEHASDGRGYLFAEALRDLFNLEQPR